MAGCRASLSYLWLAIPPFLLHLLLLRVPVTEQNQKGGSHSMGLTRRADLIHAEFKPTHLGRGKAKQVRSAGNCFSHARVKDLPEPVDRRSRGSAASAKDRGVWGSCRAFSAIAAVEGINHIVTDNLVALSEQELVHCDTKHNHGCGGLMNLAFQFIVENGGVGFEDHYPYTGHRGLCNATKMNYHHAFTIDGYEVVPNKDKEALLRAVAHQSISAAIEASGRDFRLYFAGIFSGNCAHNVDCCIAITGYGSSDGNDYWIVKNSLGSYCGEKGYIRMRHNTGSSLGLRVIYGEPSYPVKNSVDSKPAPPVGPPIMCDKTHYCQDKNTCCCTFPIGKYCFAWSCCPLESAVCCSDRVHCCPQDHPICNAKSGTCLGDVKSSYGIKMLKRVQAHSSTE